MATVTIENVAIEGVVTVIPPACIAFKADAARLGIEAGQAQRISDTVGLNERRVVSPGVTALDLGEQACKELIKGLSECSIDIGFMIFVTQTPDHSQPCNAAILHGRLGLDSSVGALDVNLGCSGYVYGLYLAASMIKSLGKDVLLVVGDTLSTKVNPLDRSASILFGDAASATLLSARENEIMYFDMCTDGSGFQSIIVPAGGARMPSSCETSIETEDDEGNVRALDDLKMIGGEVFNFAVRTEPKAIRKLLEFSQKSVEEVDMFFFHQANKYIIRTIAKRLSVPNAKVPDSIITKYGNQSSASIPCTINETIDADGHQRLSVLSGFGVGLSWASVLCNLNLKYSPLPINWIENNE
ncbi:MAG: 3-oxoacyl-[acyl-carrier-protein] synthase-3 [Nonlabens sp.]|jgi:3-oxoacyl-[acyl-carrier-protein] synthase-3